MNRVVVKTTLGALLQTGAYKVAVSLPDLVQQTNQFSVKNRPGCVPTLEVSKPKDLFMEYNVTCHLKESDPSGHEVRVHFDVDKVEETGKAKDLDIQVSCSCPAFLYWGAQWNLHMRDGLEGEPRPLLQAPTERLDLRNNFVICKHCKAVFERILPAIQNNVNNIIREREVEKNKLKQQEAPPSPKELKLREEQEKMKEKYNPQHIENPFAEKEKKILEEMRLQEEQRIKEEKKEVGEEGNEKLVTRTQPSTEEEQVKEKPSAPEEPKQVAPEPAPKPESVKEKPTDRQLLETMKEKEKKRLQDQDKTKKFLDNKYKRKRTSLEEDENESRN